MPVDFEPDNIYETFADPLYQKDIDGLANSIIRDELGINIKYVDNKHDLLDSLRYVYEKTNKED